jgi:hypothetical protein
MDDEMNTKTLEHLVAGWKAIKLGNDNAAIQSLYWAVLELATTQKQTAAEEVDQREKSLKPLTVADLRHELEVFEMRHGDGFYIAEPVFYLKHFEIRRRK